MSTALEKPGPRELADPRGASAQPPTDPVPLERRPADTVAGGIPAIVSTVKRALGEAGVIRGTRLLARINQFQGFDCPGCAWPEPDDHRSSFEFCENGAKAIAEEGTRERATPELFARFSVAEL